MSKTLPSCTFINGKHCLTETIYKGYKIYKIYSRGIERYSILKDGIFSGFYLKLKYAKDEIDSWNNDIQ